MMPFDLNAIAAPIADFLARQRWASRARRITGLPFEDTALLPHAGERYLLAFLRVEYADGGSERCFLPLARLGAGAPEPRDVIGRYETRDGVMILGDAFAVPGFRQALLNEMGENRRLP